MPQASTVILDQIGTFPRYKSLVFSSYGDRLLAVWTHIAQPRGLL